MAELVFSDEEMNKAFGDEYPNAGNFQKRKIIFKGLKMVKSNQYINYTLKQILIELKLIQIVYLLSDDILIKDYHLTFHGHHYLKNYKKSTYKS